MGSTALEINGRQYRWPKQPLVVVCLDGSSMDYIREAIAAGAAPFLSSLVSSGFVRMADAAMPTFTNPNNMSIVTGAPPSVHGINGNFFLDPATGNAVMMNDPSFLRADTIPAAFSRAGAKVVVITAKDKLRTMLSARLEGACLSAEQEGQPVYSAALSEHVLARGAEFMRSVRPDLMYLSTSDYVQHTHAPGSPEANRFYSVIDRRLQELDREGATLVITADHGMNAKPHIIYLQSLLDEWFGPGAARVILPITDPYVAHHGSLGSFATIYANGSSNVIQRLKALPGVELALDRSEACRRFDLPPDRTGDVVVCADRHTVLGTRPEDHDLSQLHAPLRSHGGLAEREVPILSNRPIPEIASFRNYDAFWIGLNGIEAEDALLREQISYYRARANEYDQWFLRQGRYDLGALHREAWLAEVAQIETVLRSTVHDAEVLELACGTGLWTRRLAENNLRVLAVDASPETISLNRQRVVSPNVEYLVADIFSWVPPSAFDAVFFSFWLSHVPPARFEQFWKMVRSALKPGGQVFFIDSLPEQTSSSGVIRRRLNDGQEFNIVKIFYEPAELQQRLFENGWTGWVRRTDNFFLYGSMRPIKPHA